MSHLSQEHVQRLYEEFGELKVLDDIIRHRAADNPPIPILGYPRHQQSVNDYELFTGKQLDCYIDGAVKKFIVSGLKPQERKTIALLAPSNLDFVVSFFALSRLGFTVLSLSLRITSTAIVNLLQKTECQTIVHGHQPQVGETLREIKQDYHIYTLCVPSRSDYDRPPSDEPYFIRDYDRKSENEQVALIIHSSGSTGLPKPVFLSHKALLTHPTQGSGLHNFNALPWYHLYGISTSLQAMWMRKTAYLYNTSVPLTADNLVAVVEKVKPEAVHVVPYVLGLLAEKQRGVDVLKGCKTVTAAGARTPDELGDRLVREGINLGVVFGTTEAGLAGDTMRREKGDDSWNYIRLYANIRQYVHMRPQGGDNTYEFVYLKGHPALSTCNSDDPVPGSWQSKDVFTPHPSIPDVWKYVTRIDDRITLINGEKVLPLPIEGRLREDPLVREAAVVGVDQPIPGLLVFRAAGFDHMCDTNFLDAIWPSIADANSRAEAFSQITRDMVRVIPSDTDYPQTDKGSIIRARLYDQFGELIKQMYAPDDDVHAGDLKLAEQADIEAWIVSVFRDEMKIRLATVESDFYSSGVDSLKAIQMRRLIQKTIDTKGNSLSTNVVYEHGNAKGLAKYLFALSTGHGAQMTDSIALMREMIGKYSAFPQHVYTHNFIYDRASRSPRHSVILTGATGSIGAHTLAQLIIRDEVEKVYCLVRGQNPLQRVFENLTEHHLAVHEAHQSKIVAFAADLSQERFDLDPGSFALMRIEVALVIHLAWPVNFNIHLQSFEPHLRGLHNLLRFSLSVHRPEPAQVFFGSSVSVALNAPTDTTVADVPVEDLTWAAETGYARSKLVGEHIVRNAAMAGARSHVLRIGQVAGDTLHGLWHDRDSIPMMIRSALTLKTLPVLEQPCSWLPVDSLAATILDICGTLGARSAGFDHGNPRDAARSRFYNLVNPRVFFWEDLHAELRACGLDFKTVPFVEWHRMLREAAAHGDEARNPAVKLINYFEWTYEKQISEKEVSFETVAAQRDSLTLKLAPRIIEQGHAKKFVKNWLRRWK